jgi:hypothetical protein
MNFDIAFYSYILIKLPTPPILSAEYLILISKTCLFIKWSFNFEISSFKIV